jgi:porphobilinogen synthase
MNSNPLPLRLSRLRQHPQSRALLAETRLHPKQFIAPIFISANVTEKTPIQSMPGQYQLPISALQAEIDEIVKLQIPAVLLFGIPEKKDAVGSDAFHEMGIVQQGIREIKKNHPDLLIISDLCFCEYTSHGHCGVLEGDCIDHDKTAAILGQQAVSHVKAGADWVAPSGMTDGMVKAIRNALDHAGFHNTPILSYSAKYCTCLYGPFREAAQGAPQFGDRKAYQMNPANGVEALREVALDLAEGADMVMVKPASLYLDIIYRIKQQHPEVPLCAYQVSGEYAMIKTGASSGMFNEEQMMIESLLAIKRAGADFIISYFAKDIAAYLQRPSLCT